MQIADDDWHFMRSHRDGASGLLQLGLTLQGSRHLRFGCHTSSTSDPLPENVWDNASGPNLITLQLTAGHVYLATPAVLEHGVAYEPNQTTVALMFRLALPDTAEEINRCRSDGFHNLAGQVARELQEALDGQKLRLPCLHDVKQAELEIRNKLSEDQI